MAIALKPSNRTDLLAECIPGLRSASIPDAVMRTTHRLALDGSGALLAAANPSFSTGRLIADFVLRQGGAPQSTVVGHADDGSVTLISRNPTSQNPRTARLVAPSVMAALSSYVSPIRVGS